FCRRFCFDRDCHLNDCRSETEGWRVGALLERPVDCRAGLYDDRNDMHSCWYLDDYCELAIVNHELDYSFCRSYWNAGGQWRHDLLRLCAEQSGPAARTARIQSHTFLDGLFGVARAGQLPFVGCNHSLILSPQSN